MIEVETSKGKVGPAMGASIVPNFGSSMIEVACEFVNAPEETHARILTRILTPTPTPA